MVDDDLEDTDLVREVVAEIGYKNRVVAFSNCDHAYQHLCNTVDIDPPFIILCDVNLPRMNGIELKQKIDADKKLRSKSIPFVFLSTTGEGHFVDKAYECCTVQGFFTKETRYTELKAVIKLILDYWSRAKHPTK